MMINLFNRCDKCRLWDYMIAASFFIYASHRIVCWKMSCVWQYVSSFGHVMRLPFGGVGLMLVEFLMTICISMLLYRLVNLYFPYIRKILCRQ